MKTTLYNIENDYIQLMQQVEENDGELTLEIEEQLAITESQRDGKSIAYLSIITKVDSETTLIDNEIKRLQALKKRNNNIVTKLQSRLLDAVNLFGSYSVNLTKFGTRKSTSVEVEDINALPKEFKTIKVVESADKIAIGKALKAGESIAGCSLSENVNLKIN